MKHARIAWAGAVHHAVADGSGLRLADGTRLAEDEVVWLPPVQPGTVIALGINYADHKKELAKELTLSAKDEPLAFLKGPNALVGHRGRTRARSVGTASVPGAQQMHVDEERARRHDVLRQLLARLADLGAGGGPLGAAAAQRDRGDRPDGEAGGGDGRSGLGADEIAAGSARLDLRAGGRDGGYGVLLGDRVHDLVSLDASLDDITHGAESSRTGGRARGRVRGWAVAGSYGAGTYSPPGWLGSASSRRRRS